MLGPCVAKFSTLRMRQNGRHFADNIFRNIFSNQDCYILIQFQITLKFVPKGPINEKPLLKHIYMYVCIHNISIYHMYASLVLNGLTFQLMY